MLRPLLSLLLGLVAVGAATNPQAKYSELLELEPLSQGTLLASFNFRSNASQQSFDQQHFQFFPRSLGQILQHAHTKELHLRFSSGRWDEGLWGPRPHRGVSEGGTGVEIWAWIDAQSDQEAEKRWLTLANALSGLFCASLNFIDSTKTIKPVLAFEPDGQHVKTPNLHLLHGALPHEVVCTENLTPFLKLLPCKGKAGIASLLDGHKLFDSTWQSMAIDVRPLCQGHKSECAIEMQQTVSMALDIERSKRPRDDPIPRPPPKKDLICDESKPYQFHGDACYPIPPPSYPHFTLTEIFGRPIKGSCPLSHSGNIEPETVCINAPSERLVSVKTTGAFSHRRVSASRACYKIPTGESFDLVVEEYNENGSGKPHEPLLHAERTITGYGQESGGIHTVLTNPSSSEAVNFVYLEALPWFMKPYIHTLKSEIKPLDKRSSIKHTLNPIKDMYYRPAVDRVRATHLELSLSVPPASSLTLSYDFHKTILRIAEYPPDANRGFDIAPAIIRVLGRGQGSDSTYIRTTSLLLYLPTPDFSMPYNVIILTSTVIALGFGSIFNLLVRRLVSAEEANAASKGRLSQLIKARVASIKYKLRGGKGKTE